MVNLGLQFLGNLFNNNNNRGIILSDNDNYINILLNALKIFSPSGKEGEMSNFLYDFLKNNGFKNVKKDKIGNVIGEIGDKKPVLLLSSHMDTINDYIEIEEDEIKIKARGAIDAKGPLMALAIAASKFSKRKINGKIIFAGIVQEEISIRGINIFLDNNFEIDYAIFAEPNQTTNIVVAYKGRAALRVKVTSKKGSGHPANSWLFDNSIELAYSFYQKIKELCNTKYTGKTPYFSVIPTITEFRANEGKNVIPSKAEFYIDLRFPTGINSKQIFDDFEKVKQDFIDKNDCIINFEPISIVNPYSISPKNKIIKILSRSIEEAIGVKSKLTRKTGTTFMNVIGNRLKIPTISIGPGDPKLEHTKNEYILKKDFLNEIKIIEKFIENLFGLED